MEIVENDSLETVAGGFETVSDPIYKLTLSEERVLKKAGYKIDKTKKGNCRVTDSRGNTIDPKTLEGMCKVVKIADDEASRRHGGRTFWDFLAGY